LDDKAKESIRQHEPRLKGGGKDKEIIELRRELADLKNQFNQQKGNGGKYQDRPYQAGGRWGGEEDKADMTRIGGRF
jgi:hypothetical protein